MERVNDVDTGIKSPGSAELITDRWADGLSCGYSWVNVVDIYNATYLYQSQHIFTFNAYAFVANALFVP